MNLDQETLAQLLKEAQSAHHIYEQELGKADVNWASWYARYIFEKLEDHS